VEILFGENAMAAVLLFIARNQFQLLYEHMRFEVTQQGIFDGWRNISWISCC
jgi:hypothetical protein